MQSPFRSKSTVNLNASIDHEGWLVKLGAVVKNWQKRYFVLRETNLAYFDDKDKALAGEGVKGVLNVQGAQITTFVDKKYKSGFAFIVFPPNSKRKYVFVADDENERAQWIAALLRAGAIDADSEFRTMADQSPSNLEGYLTKLGARVKNWRRRYFVLRDGVLIYYDERFGDPTPKGKINVNGASTRSYQTTDFGKPWCFGITARGTKRELLLVAENDQERLKWLTAFASSGAFDDESAGISSGGTDEPPSSPKSRPQSPTLASSSVASRTPGEHKDSRDATGGETVEMESYLQKLGDVRKSWKKRYCVLKSNGVLYYFETHFLQSKAKGTIVVEGARFTALDGANYSHPKEFALGITPRGGKRMFVMLADSDLLRSKWLAALHHSSNPVAAPGKAGKLDDSTGVNFDHDDDIEFDEGMKLPPPPTPPPPQDDEYTEILKAVKAVKGHDFNAVRTLLLQHMQGKARRNSDEDAAQTDKFEDASVLHIAIVVIENPKRQRDVVRALIKAGAPVDNRCKKIEHTWLDDETAHKYQFLSCTPLHLAVVLDGDEVFGSGSTEALLRAGANPDTKCGTVVRDTITCVGASCLTLAVTCNSVRLMVPLISAGADPNVFADSVADSVSMQTRRGGKLYKKNKMEHVAVFHVAASRSDTEMCGFLIYAGGANPNLKCKLIAVDQTFPTHVEHTLADTDGAAIAAQLNLAPLKGLLETAAPVIKLADHLVPIFRELDLPRISAQIVAMFAT